MSLSTCMAPRSREVNAGIERGSFVAENGAAPGRRMRPAIREHPENTSAVGSAIRDGSLAPSSRAPARLFGLLRHPGGIARRYPPDNRIVSVPDETTPSILRSSMRVALTLACGSNSRIVFQYHSSESSPHATN